MSGTIYDTLRRLVGWESEPEALALSLYLDVSRGQESAAPDRARAAVAELLEALDEKPGSDDFVELVESWLARLPRLVAKARARDHDGLALFLCAAPRLEELVTLRFAFETRASVGSRLGLAQLLTVAEEYERTAAVVVAGGRARVLDLHVGDIARAHDVAASERRDLAGELSVALRRLIADDPALHLVLLGAPGELAALEASLADDLRARVIERVGWSDGDEGEQLKAVHRALQRYERRSEAAGVAALLERREAGGEGAAVGLDETLAAVNGRRARVLYMLQGFHGRGWMCDVCDRLGAPPSPPACLACGATVSEVDLEEHLLGAAAADGAEIETVFDSPALLAAGGLGALLRDRST